MTRRGFLGTSIAASAASALSAQQVAGSNERLGIGILGCGTRNLLKEVLEFHRETNVEVRAVCDIWRQARERAVEQVKEATAREPKAIHAYEDMFSMNDIDAVVIGTPDFQHCTQLVAAIAAGKDVYVEKPLAMNMEELIEAVDAVKKSDRVVQMGTQVRSFPTSKAGRDFVQARQLGNIFKIEQSRNSYKPYWHRYGEREIVAADTDWKRFLMGRRERDWDADQYAAWFGYREFSRGPHSNLMPHFIDLVHYVTGANFPRRVMTMGGIYRWKDQRSAPDSVETVLDYADEGFLVRYNTTFGISSNSFLKFMGTRGTLDATRWGDSWKISGEGIEDEDRIPEDTELAEAESTPHMKNWLECLRTRQQPNAPIDAGYGHSVAVIMADEALIRGRQMVYDHGKREIREG
jgi:predicted dehydrogenase